MRNYELKLVDSSRLIADWVVQDIGDSKERFGEMLNLCLRDTYPLSMRAARALALSAGNHPSIIQPFLTEIINALKHIKNEGVRRGFLKIFVDLDPILTEDQIGLLTDLTFTWLDDPKQALAIRYYSIEILLKVTALYPELSTELLAILKGFDESAPPSLQVASNKAIKDIYKLKRE